MATDKSPKRASGENDDLLKLARELADAVGASASHDPQDDDLLDFPISDDMIASDSAPPADDSFPRILANVKRRSEATRRLRESSTSQGALAPSFAATLSAARLGASLSLQEMAAIVGLSPKDLERFERDGVADPRTVSPDIVARILDALSLSLARFSGLLDRDLRARKAYQRISQPSARGAGVTSQDYARIVSEALSDLSSQEPLIDEMPAGLLDAIASALRRRGRSDLA